MDIEQILVAITFGLLSVLFKKLVTDNLPSFKITLIGFITRLKKIRVATVKFEKKYFFSLQVIDFSMNRVLFIGVFLFVSICLSSAIYSYSINSNNPLAEQLFGFRMCLLIVLMFICSFIPRTPIPNRNNN
jgi:hypothetical protein